MSNDRFDKEAAEWDNNPTTVKSSKAALDSLLHHVPGLGDEKKLTVLEIGCGTGLLTVQLAPKAKHITAVDTSSGMISALESKLASNASLSNVKAVCVLLEDADDPRIQQVKGTPQRFDLVVSHLVLHHIPDLSSILRLMYATLRPGGSIALTDYENYGPEARAFHPESKMDGVERHGITREEMREVIEGAGFVDVKVEHAFDLQKEVESGGDATFPFLICLATKSVSSSGGR